MTKPIEFSGPDRRGKACRCVRCGIVAICRPDFDFYTYQAFANASDFLALKPMPTPLYCEICYRNKLHEEGTSTILMKPIGDPEVIQ